MCQSPWLAQTLLLSSLLLTGCGPGAPVLVRQAIPPSLLVCQGQPEPPPAPFDDTALALWIVDLANAGADCRARLAAVKGLVQP